MIFANSAGWSRKPPIPIQLLLLAAVPAPALVALTSPDEARGETRGFVLGAPGPWLRVAVETRGEGQAREVVRASGEEIPGQNLGVLPGLRRGEDRLGGDAVQIHPLGLQRQELPDALPGQRLIVETRRGLARRCRPR